MKQVERIQVADAAAAAAAALDLVQHAAAQAIARRGRFVMALAGGNTPRLLYERLATTAQDWRRWHLVYGDERCLPRGDPGRNSTLVDNCWLSRIDFPGANHHVPAAEQGAEAAAADYARAIAPLLPLDFALLGMGEDGHTASLFPGHRHPALPVVPVHNAPKPPPERISLSYGTLNAAAWVCLLVTGAAKADALARCLQGQTAPGELVPAARLAGRERTVLITDIMT